MGFGGVSEVFGGALGGWSFWVGSLGEVLGGFEAG